VPDALTRSILKQLTRKQAVAGPPGRSELPDQRPHEQSADVRSKQARNKANTIRNWAKVENYLMEVEKVHGCAKSWALRERLEQGHVSLDDLKQR
jgi:hypothetical protein